MAGIDSDNVLIPLMLAQMEPAIEDATAIMLQKLEAMIDQYVYAAGTPVKYPRQRNNGGLRQEFEISDDSIKTENSVAYEIFDNPDSLNIDQERFIHGSTVGYANDIRDLLIDIIINGGSGTPHVGSHFDFANNLFFKEPRDFWSPFIHLFEDGTVETVVKDCLKKHGFNII